MITICFPLIKNQMPTPLRLIVHEIVKSCRFIAAEIDAVRRTQNLTTVTKPDH